MNEPIKVFLSYSHQDDELRKELSSHLSSLYHDQSIEPWHDRDIDAGSDWAEAIDENLEQAGIILLLVSADFINSRCGNLSIDYRFDGVGYRVVCAVFPAFFYCQSWAI